MASLLLLLIAAVASASPGEGEGEEQRCAGGRCEVLTPLQAEYAKLLPPERFDGSVLTLGAVVQSAEDLALWQAVKSHCAKKDVAVDFIYYANYERLAMSAFHGHFALGWHSPVSYAETVRMAAAYGFQTHVAITRESLKDRTAVCVTRDDAVQGPKDLSGKRVAFGAGDSAFGTLLPLFYLQRESGMVAGEGFLVDRSDIGLGGHGFAPGAPDQRAAARKLDAGEADAACFDSTVFEALQAEGELLQGARVFATTEGADAGGFVALDTQDEVTARAIEELRAVLADNDGDDEDAAAVRAAGFTDGRDTAFAAVVAGVEAFKYADAWLESLGAVDGGHPMEWDGASEWDGSGDWDGADGGNWDGGMPPFDIDDFNLEDLEFGSGINDDEVPDVKVEVRE